MNHKIVCWGDYAIPVPKKAKWIAMDKSNRWFWYEHKPWLATNIDEWRTEGGQVDRLSSTDLCPPEPGPWTEQLYWIGD